MSCFMISGTGSGVGKYLAEEYAKQGHKIIKLKRREDDCGFITNWRYDDISQSDALIHCAFNSVYKITTEMLHEYISGNLFLTERLASFYKCSIEDSSKRGRKFIYFSSIQVYPLCSEISYEDDPIDIEQVSSTYGKIKLMAEAMVRKHMPNHLIVRLPSILGKYMRHNSLVAAVTGSSNKLTLTADSTNSYIGYEDIKRFIGDAIVNDLRGTYNLVANDYIKMSDVCAMFDASPEFGVKQYNPPFASNKKVVAINELLNKSSEQVVKEFAKIWKKTYK